MQITYKFKQTSKLSNYYVCRVAFDNRIYNSSEAAYQSMKTLNREYRDMFTGISCDDAKHLGREIQANGLARKDWEKVKDSVMYQVCKAKFTQNLDCKRTLMMTGNKLIIEDTTGWHDNIWGNCYCDKCKNIVGQNLLGKTLMKLREDFRNNKT